MVASSLLAVGYTCLDALVAVLTVLTVHLVHKGTAFLAGLMFPPARPRPFTTPLEWAKLTETFATWDSGWYFDIA